MVNTGNDVTTEVGMQWVDAMSPQWGDIYTTYYTNLKKRRTFVTMGKKKPYMAVFDDLDRLAINENKNKAGYTANP